MLQLVSRFGTKVIDVNISEMSEHNRIFAIIPRNAHWGTRDSARARCCREAESDDENQKEGQQPKIWGNEVAGWRHERVLGFDFWIGKNASFPSSGKVVHPPM
jgi:hypothetical protein